jgi:hypothetical protein
MTTDIVTLAEYKVYASITSINQDAAINQLIPTVTKYIQNYCNRVFVDYYSTPKVEVFTGGTSIYFPKEFPLVSIISLEQSFDNGQTYSTLVNYNDFVVDLEASGIVPVQNDFFDWYLNGYKLTYTSGYATYPEDLKIAAMDLIAYYMKSDMAVKSNRTPGSNASQVEYIMNSGLPSHIRRILDSYRNNA